MLAIMIAAVLVQDDAMYDLVKTGKVAALSSDFKGTPFGSLMPYALDAKGNPIIYISDLAVHTKNLNKNPACSLMVSKVKDDDIFNSQRITFVGKMKRVPKEDVEAVKKIFYGKFKEAEDYAELHDFGFYRMEISTIFYIGGFGDINWVKTEDYQKGFGK